MTDEQIYQQAAADLFRLANVRLPQLKEDMARLLAIAEDTATRTLLPNAKHQLVLGDRVPLELAAQHLRPAYDALTQTIDRLYGQNPIGATWLYGALVNFACAFFEIGVRATVTDSAKKYFAENAAACMREARTNTPEEKALLAAIVAERGNCPVARPTKEAGVILEGVNKRLQADGHDPVKIDVIRRRLEKLPRS